MPPPERVPVIEVHKDNFVELWPSLLNNVKNATFIAIDAELSGLGNRKLLNAKSIDDRYQHMCEVAKTRSMLSLGLSCFQLQNSSHQEVDSASVTPGTRDSAAKSGHIAWPRKTSATSLHFLVETYNIFLLCDEEYVVEPLSLRFLVEHGFDFNKQYSQGMPYHRGMDKIPKKGEESMKPSIRQLFSEMVLSKAPIVFHNGVVDLVFMYENLYTPLPASHQAFLADLDLMFPGGIFDTKYITEFKVRMGASYLEYVFRKCQRDNITSTEQGWSHISLDFRDCLSACSADNVAYVPCNLFTSHNTDAVSINDLCLQYAHHGWCPAGSACAKSHDIDIILNSQEQDKKKRKHKQPKTDTTTQSKPRMQGTEQDMETDDKAEPLSANGLSHSLGGTTIEGGNSPGGSTDSDSTTASRNPSLAVCGSHRAGFDAFMTGFIFAFYTARYGKPAENSSDGADSTVSLSDFGMEEFQNKCYLVAKDIPLQITRSSFSKPSKGHREKYEKLKPYTV